MPDWFTGDNIIISALTTALGWFVNEWRLERQGRRDADTARQAAIDARNTDAQAAANVLFEQRLVNQQSLARIGLLEYQVADQTRDLERCERENERWRTSPPKEQPA